MKVYLQNYLADLAYQFEQGGIEYVNANSNGTPYFKSVEEFDAYCAKIESAIEACEK